ncbi:penicillin-binding protein, partial [Klebsiella oxytoca]
YLTGTSGQVVGKIFKAEAESLLPYSQGSQFQVADAYMTGGKLMAADEVPDPNESTDNDDWKKSVDEFAENAKEGFKDFGERVKQGTKELFGNLWNTINGN